MNTVIDQVYELQQLELHPKAPSPEIDVKILELRKTIPPTILGHYGRLMERGKKGVAIVRNGVCSECHMQVAIGVVHTLSRREDIQLCGSCGRYLYLPEQGTPAPAPAPAPEPAKPAPRRRKPKTASNVK